MPRPTIRPGPRRRGESRGGKGAPEPLTRSGSCCSEWTEELTYRLINQHSIHQLPTLVTSNLPISDLRAQIGDRVASRLAGMCEQVVRSR